MSSANGHAGNSIVRFNASFPCPVCGGSEDDPRGAGKRCFGFIGKGGWIHCSRDEFAGQTKYHSTSETWSHKPTGKCDCGQEHAPANPTPAARPKTRVVAVYDYHGPDGKVAHRTLRYEPKRFGQCRPNPEVPGKWICNLKGVTTYPYRLPEILKADPMEWVIVVEGEKDADQGAKFGLITTSNPMGAGKWKPHFSEHLKGRRVAIVADNDQAGKEHAQAVATSLVGLAVEIKVVELLDIPEKGDLSDYLDRGHSITDFKRLVENTQTWIPKARIFKLDDGIPPKTDQSPADVFTNWEDAGFDEKGHALKRSLLAPEIDALRRKAIGEWPKRVQDRLFRETPDHKIQFLDSSERVFATVDGASVKVDWAKGASMIPQARYYEHLCLSSDAVEEFDAVEQYPHWPPRPRTYYAHPEIPPFDGQSHIDVFLGFFKPSTPEDAALLRAFFLTLFWGGMPGQRPGFVFEGPKNDPELGRGVGKTTVVEIMAGGFVGGDIRISSAQSFDDVKKRLFSPGALGKRVILLDNLKTDRLSNPELEEAMTCEIISGKAMYVGEGSRPNTFTWAITVNGASLSKDMASRTYMIRVDRAIYSDEWKTVVLEFIEKNRTQILSEVGAILTAEPTNAKVDGRWAHWERQVLSRATDAEMVGRVQTLAKERREDADDDNETMNRIRDFIIKQLTKNGFDPDEVCIVIPTSVLTNWLRQANDEPALTATKTTHLLKRMGIPELLHKRTNSSRFFFWAGTKSEDRSNPSSLQESVWSSF